MLNKVALGLLFVWAMPTVSSFGIGLLLTVVLSPYLIDNPNGILGVALNGMLIWGFANLFAAGIVIIVVGALYNMYVFGKQFVHVLLHTARMK